jgi:hypothetical protein
MDSNKEIEMGGNTSTTTTSTNPWLAHVKQFHTAHPELSYKQALKEAKDSYTKVPKKEPTPEGEKKPNPWMQHIANFKKENPDWPQLMSYKEVLIRCKETYNKKKTV